MDYILIDEKFIEICFVTSYNNFISDHNSTVLRVGLNDNEFTEEIKERLTFDRDSHLRTKVVEEELSGSNLSSDEIDQFDHSLHGTITDDSDKDEEETERRTSSDQTFKRRFGNSDMTTCWLNSCLQLVLNAMDHIELVERFPSELAEELMKLQSNQKQFPLDSTFVKHIIVTAEDTRIATRISEVEREIRDPFELENRIGNIRSLRLDMLSGQQCVRDFFLCITENVLNWPDVFSFFGFKITHSSQCCNCNFDNQHEITQMYVELQVPPDGSSLNDYVEEYFNSCSLVGAFCENGCKQFAQSEKRSSLTKADETKFLTIILTRAVETLDGFQLNRSNIIPTNDIWIRYKDTVNTTNMLLVLIVGMQKGWMSGMKQSL